MFLTYVIDVKGFLLVISYMSDTVFSCCQCELSVNIP